MLKHTETKPTLTVAYADDLVRACSLLELFATQIEVEIEPTGESVCDVTEALDRIVDRLRSQPRKANR